MPVELDQWGTPAFGTVETVSMSSTVNNGVATTHYHSVDNTEGTLQVNSYINFKITASENDNCLVLPLQCVRKISKEDGSTIDVVFVKGDRPDNAVETPMLEEEIPSGFWAVPVEIGIPTTPTWRSSPAWKLEPRSLPRSSPCRRMVDAYGETLD